MTHFSSTKFPQFSTKFSTGGAGTSPQQEPQEKRPNAWQIKKEQERTERKRLSRIAKIDQRLGEIAEEKSAVSAQLSAPETASDYEKILELTALLETLEKEEGALETEWLELNA